MLELVVHWQAVSTQQRIPYCWKKYQPNNKKMTCIEKDTLNNFGNQHTDYQIEDFCLFPKMCSGYLHRKHFQLPIFAAQKYCLNTAVLNCAFLDVGSQTWQMDKHLFDLALQLKR